MVSTVRFSICVAAAALLFHAVSFGQTTRTAPSTMDAATSRPLDMRVGVARPVDSTDNITDGGIRTAPSLQTLSAPLVSIGKDYQVGPNDLIEIEIYDADNLKRTVRVNAAGAISLPLIGHLAVGGMTTQQIEILLTQKYGEKYLQNPQVSVFIKEFTSERITVEGAVSRPGIFPLTGKITLLRALAMAGGFGPIADSSKVMLYRVDDQKARHVAVYDIDMIRAGKSEDPPIQGDDLIVVQRDSTRVLLKDSLLRDVIDSVNPFSILAPK